MIARIKHTGAVGLFTLVLVLTACGSGSPTATGGEAETPLPPNTVGPEGGTLDLAGGAVRLVILPGALSSNVTISVLASSPSLPDPTVAGTEFGFEPAGTAFARPAQLTIEFDPTAVASGIQENELKLYQVNEDFCQNLESRLECAFWDQVLGSSADVIDNTVTGDITSLGSFASLSPAADVELSPDSAKVLVGSTVQLLATVRDQLGRELRHRSVDWVSSDGAIASVDSRGLTGGAAPGQATITATSEGRRSGSTVVAVVQGSLLSVAGDGQVGSLGRPLSNPLIVKVAEPSGNGVPGVTVNWFLSDGNISTAARVTDSAGLAQVLWTLGTTTGAQTATQQTVTASVVGAGSVTFTATTPSLVPLTDMGASTYFGFPGGLYPGGNVMPQAHADAGRAFAAAVQPLDANGNPSTDGKYVLLAIGHSNTMLTFCNTEPGQPCPSFTFVGQAIAEPDVDKTNLAIVRGAGARAEFWVSPNPTCCYDHIRDVVLGPLGLSEQQVQVVWAELHTRAPTTTLPHPDAQAYHLVGQLGNIMRAFRSRYPNLRLVFLSSGVYLGHRVTPTPDGDITRHNREPREYETGFAMKWLIQAQIDQMASGGTIVDGRAGDLNYSTAVPWIGWDPYLWADGVNPRSDGLFWSRENYNSDALHLNPEGRQKVASLLLTFFKTSPQARCWFLNTGVTC